MSERIEEIKKALVAATPGPWEVVNLGNMHIAKDYRQEDGKHKAQWIADLYIQDELWEEQAANNAHLIAKAPEYISYLLKLEQSLQEDIMMLKDMVSTARKERDEIKLLVDTPKLNLLQQRDNERIAKNKALSEAERFRLQYEATQSQIAVKNEELKTAYNALEKIQEEFKQLDTGAAEDYQKLIEAQQTITKLHEIVEEGRNALNSIIEGEWEETMDDQFLEVWTTRRINPPAIADEALFCMARQLEALGE